MRPRLWLACWTMAPIAVARDDAGGIPWDVADRSIVKLFEG